MAKGKTGARGSGAFNMRVMKAADLPWAAIEARIDIEFDELARKEIYRCYVAYFAHLSVESDRAPLEEVEALRQSLLSSAQGLLAVLERFRGNGPGSNSDEALYSALAFASTAEGFDLTRTLQALKPHCEDLLHGLGDDAIELDVTRRTPEATALANFFKEAVRGAHKQQARSVPNYTKTPSAYELRRWNVSLGPKSLQSAEFASAILDRPVTLAQVEHAFNIAKDL